jgi:hypothetical protein
MSPVQGETSVCVRKPPKVNSKLIWVQYQSIYRACVMSLTRQLDTAAVFLFPSKPGTSEGFPRFQGPSGSRRFTAFD